MKIKVKDWLEAATSLFSKADIPSAQLDAELLLCDALNVSREWLIIHSEDEIPKNTAKEALKRRQNREPLAYIRGYKEFYGRNFIVNKDVLIPRPESEVIIEAIQRLLKSGQSIVDVGTGSGALAITAALELSGSVVTACDVSKKALAVAAKNAKKLHAEITFVVSDLLSEIDTPHDIIIANLPYVDKSWKRSPETAFEPSLALFAADNGAALIKKLIAQTKNTLAPGGYVLLEADPRQHTSIIKFAIGYSLQKYSQQGFIVVLKKI